ncbi:MAG: CPXCG motif-containing cysteine-rich protein [Gemmatimonadetes bacterium]|nr:CPXCG motif-containing cysteine-rich protein [Gemmatimonadota bacterium]
MADEDPEIREPDATELAIPSPTEPGMVTHDDTIPCPYCGTENSLFLEPSSDSSEQEYVEECRQCGYSYAIREVYEASGEPRIHAEQLPD